MTGMDEARRLIAIEREARTGFLDLGNLGLAELPAELFELTHLTALNLGYWYWDDQHQWQRSVNDAANGGKTAWQRYQMLFVRFRT